MSRFDDYATKYTCIHMRRENGILEMRFHTDDGPLRWGLGPHGELPDAFADVARDRENRVVILTGTGDEWSGARAMPGQSAISPGVTANAFDRVHWEGRALLMNLLRRSRTPRTSRTAWCRGTACISSCLCCWA
jgi:enoyl-CoA hydratase/carnithine racemase